MRKRWLLFSYSILILSIGFVNTAFAQNQADTRTGCLIRGSKAGTYYLVDTATGRRTEISGTGLDRLTEGGEVQVSTKGSLVHEGGREVYQSTEVQQTRAICDPFAYNADALKAEVGRARFGARAGIALDPELVVVGAQAQFGPFFKEIWFRPSFEFEFGEVTKIANFNGDAIYFIPSAGVGQKGHLNAYVGGGVGFNLLRRNFNGFPNQPNNVFPDDWAADFGMNLLVGVMKSNGLFAELRSTVWMEPTVRLYVGYNFH